MTDERLSGALQKVYYLHDSDTGALLYIGRGANPVMRQRAFERRTKLRTIMGPCQRYHSFEDAQVAERNAIQLHQPPHNKKIMSARGMYGRKHTEQTKAAIGARHAGKTQTAEARAKISAARKGGVSAFKGHSHTAETKAVLSAKATGRQHTEEAKKKMSETRRGAPSPLKGRILGPQKNPRKTKT